MPTLSSLSTVSTPRAKRPKVVLPVMFEVYEGFTHPSEDHVGHWLVTAAAPHIVAFCPRVKKFDPRVGCVFCLRVFVPDGTNLGRVSEVLSFFETFLSQVTCPRAGVKMHEFHYTVDLPEVHVPPFLLITRTQRLRLSWETRHRYDTRDGVFSLQGRARLAADESVHLWWEAGNEYLPSDGNSDVTHFWEGYRRAEALYFGDPTEPLYPV